MYINIYIYTTHEDYRINDDDGAGDDGNDDGGTFSCHRNASFFCVTAQLKPAKARKQTKTAEN